MSLFRTAFSSASLAVQFFAIARDGTTSKFTRRLPENQPIFQKGGSKSLRIYECLREPGTLAEPHSTPIRPRRTRAMPTSQARIEANQRNAKRSSGPRISEGKTKSRMNSTKHSYTGDAIVIPNEDAQALEEKLASFEDALKPQDAVQLELVKRFGLMTVRLDRMVKQEAKATAMRMRNAASLHEDARMAEADHLISWIAHEPVTNNRRLKRTPEGLKRLIVALEGLRSDLTRQPSCRWDYAHCDQLHHYLGMRREEMPITRARVLTEAIHGKFEHIDPSEIPESETMAKRRWAIRELVELIDGEIARLKTLLETFDMSIVAIDRAEAADRAMFDDSKEGILARKYEAACERSMYKALKELKAMQAESTEVESDQPPAPEPAEELGSFFPELSAAEDAKAIVDPETPTKRPNLEKRARPGRKRSKTT
jgi:hypothetical protein